MRNRGSSLLAIAVAWGTLGVAGWAQAATPAGRSTEALDQSINSYIQNQLTKKKELSSVQARVEDRVVTLTGTVPSYRADLEAEHVARQVASVNGVVNRIQVAGPTVPDSQLQKNIAEHLTYDRMGMGQTFNFLTVNVHDGVATLGGEVRDYPDRDSALAIAADTKGVKGVVDHVQVAPTSQFDDQLRFEAARAIYGNPTLQRYGQDPAHPIRIIVNNGRVTLAGVVDSQVDKQVAQSALAGITGIFSVNNQLIVAGANKPKQEK
jgi:osmotically-inducible protein OsmY